ncbi:MAG: acetolactate decarboxylase [Oscillospiraceae bacterium]|nr:acetolactate decarboxylase [Oscillospiraceae bacterium]
MENTKIFQVSTVQALSLGYTRSVISVGELLAHGNTGLGTFEDLGGEMIVIDGHCYRALPDGSVIEEQESTGVPFASVGYLHPDKTVPFGEIGNIQDLKEQLTMRIDEDFSLNSMHIVRIDGVFAAVSARSVGSQRSHHVTLKDMMGHLQKSFTFRNIPGSLVGIYYPDYMDGINVDGWHLHFISADRKHGGHVYDLTMESGTAMFSRQTCIEIQLPHEPSFDTYSLKDAMQSEIADVEKGDKG